MVDFHQIARRWQREWEEKRIFEADADPSRKKFFVTFPYPYMNGYPHAGQAYTLMRVEAFARYKRMQGFNVLFPQGWHATGSPIDTAAKRVAEKEEKQISILKSMGFKDKDIPKFKDPEHWIKTFSKAAEQDYRTFGVSIDWRRSFVTTDLNPRYSKFIQWQFNRLKENGYVIKGEHPVVWCPKENAPVGDHARAEGEGEVPEEIVLIKFRYGHLIIPTATYRPETSYGVTNLWINPKVEYVEAKVNDELWIVSEPSVEKLKNQKFKVDVIKKIKAKELLNKVCENPVTKNKVPILPAEFVNAENGTGIVMSVPSHAPYDWIALKEIQSNPEKFGVLKDVVKNVSPISLIKLQGFGAHPAIEICEHLKIKNQKDEKLEEATKEIYKKEFHIGVLKENTGAYKGMIVQEAKQRIIKDFSSKGFATKCYELSGEVICRCLAKCVVRIVDDQWFLKYSDEEWKKAAMKCLEEMKIYPEKIRPQFEYVIDWVRDWACTREFGLGTRLPWDKKWLIESLSDSTIYMAYYTTAHIIKDIPIKDIDDSLFDYVFLGKNAKIKVDKKAADKMKGEFSYWYPVDFRNSGKDLVQNHLVFYIFNHVAIFPEKFWPRGIGVNGYVNIEKIKMSKSKGVFKLLRELISAFAPDVTRLSILSSGEELADVDWLPELAFNMKNKLENWHNFALENYGKGDSEFKDIDKWMDSQLNKIIKDATAAMDSTLYRTAITQGFFDLQRALKWYLRRKAGSFNKELMRDIIEVQTKLLAPFTPHLCEEIWHKLGKEGYISLERWPAYDKNKINEVLDVYEKALIRIVEDISAVIELSKLEKVNEIRLFVAEDWKYEALKAVKRELDNTRNAGEIIKKLMQTKLKNYSKEISILIPKLVRNPGRIPAVVTHEEAELKFLEDSKKFFEKEFNCKVSILRVKNSKEEKAKQAMPGKPAILVE